MKDPPGRYQELDLFIKVLRLLCPNLTDASKGLEGPIFYKLEASEGWTLMSREQTIAHLIPIFWSVPKGRGITIPGQWSLRPPFQPLVSKR